MAAKKVKEKTEKKKISKEELENLIVDLGKKGTSQAKIGIMLKAEYGIKSEKKIKKILEEKGIKKELPEQIADLIKRAEALKKHLIKNKMDEVAKRGLQITLAKIIRLGKYFKKKKILAKDWVYSGK